MPLIFNGTTIKAVNFNGTVVKELIYNGVSVFTADKEVFVDGELGDDVVVSGFSNSGSKLQLNYSRSPKSSGSTSGTIKFDFTDYSSLKIKGTTFGEGGYADCTIKLGIDSASETLKSEGGGYHWSETAFERTYDISAMTGEHNISGYISIDNKTSEVSWTASARLHITEIIAYA